MVEALDAIEVTLVDRADAQEAGMLLGTGFAVLTDSDLDRSGLVDGAALALVDPRGAEVVKVAFEMPPRRSAGIAEHPVGPLTVLAGGRPREGAVEGVDFGQEADVGVGVAAREGSGRCPPPVPTEPVSRNCRIRRVIWARDRPLTFSR